MRDIVVGIVAAAELALVVPQVVRAEFGRAVKNSQGPIVQRQLIEHLYGIKSTRMRMAGVT